MQVTAGLSVPEQKAGKKDARSPDLLAVFPGVVQHCLSLGAEVETGVEFTLRHGVLGDVGLGSLVTCRGRPKRPHAQGVLFRHAVCSFTVVH